MKNIWLKIPYISIFGFTNVPQLTIKYYLRSESKTASVYISVSVSRGKVFRKRTKFITDSSRWANGYPKEPSLRLSLKELEAKIEKSFNRAEVINDSWLENILSHRKADTVSSHVDNIITNAHKRKNHKGGYGLSDGRIKLYRSFQKKIDEFEEGIKIEQIDMSVAEEFRDWLFDKGYALNTVGKYVELLKTTVRDYGVTRLDKMKKISERYTPLVLSEEEIQRVNELKGLSERLENARKWFKLGIATGQRGGDLLGLTEKNIKTVNGLKMFELKQEKTGKVVSIPFKEEIEMPYPISLQKFNDALKDLCQEAKINEMVRGLKKQGKDKPSIVGDFQKWEIISSHDLRRTFATRHYGKIPTPLIMAITGHGSENTFLRYIGKTSLDSAIEFAKYL